MSVAVKGRPGGQPQRKQEDVRGSAVRLPATKLGSTWTPGAPQGSSCRTATGEDQTTRKALGDFMEQSEGRSESRSRQKQEQEGRRRAVLCSQ
jgi:hypothetical protein